MKPKRALHINSYFPSNAIHYNFLRTILRKRKDIFYIPVYKHFRSKENNYPEVEIDYIYNGLDKKVFFTKIFKCLFRYFRKNYNTSDFEYLHAHTLISDGIPAYILSILFGKPLVISVRSTDISMYIKRSLILKNIAGIILKRAKIIYFISPSLKSETEALFSKKFNEKYYLLPNGLDDYWLANLFNESAGNNLKCEDEVNILFVGQIIPRKNLKLLLEFVARYSDRRYVLNIVGKNYDNLNFDDLRANLNNNNEINYLGEIRSKVELKEIYRKNDVFVLLSRKETFGVVFTEALSQGLPIIYTKGQAVDGYFVNGEVGYSCSPDSIAELHSKIKSALENKVNLRKNMRDKIHTFQWDTIINNYLKNTNLRI